MQNSSNKTIIICIISCFLITAIFLPLSLKSVNTASAKTAAKKKIITPKFVSKVIKRDKPLITAEFVGKKSDVMIRIAFTTKSLKKEDIRNEILSEFKLSDATIRKYLKIDSKQHKRKLTSTLQSTAKVGKEESKIISELHFSLNTTKKTVIISGISSSLSALKLGHVTLK
jgi:hypothetical protein